MTKSRVSVEERDAATSSASTSDLETCDANRHGDETILVEVV